MKACTIIISLVFAAFWGSVSVMAEASGPDVWDVTGVRSDDALNMHTEASARSKTILRIPYDAKGLKNLGCTGIPTFRQWQAMTEAERIRSARARWCKVEYQGNQGWVAGRFLKEGTAGRPQTTTFGAWTLQCDKVCVLEQRGVGSARPTVLRLEPREGSNAAIDIDRRGMPKRGMFSVYMDGELITQGQIASLSRKGGNRLGMDPDDITLGLLRQMARHKNMVMSFPGEERGVEIHLERFEEAWQRAQQKR
ncbi:MAG: hypothetical protein RLZ98_2059 [Pseudomonadota bacterium]|jgi:hypothetical protein